MAVRTAVLVTDDVTGQEYTETEASQGVTITVGDVSGELDLATSTLDALQAMVQGDPSLLRLLFGPAPTRRITGGDAERIREWARAQVNEDGTPLFEVSDTGRIAQSLRAAYMQAQNAAADAGEQGEGEQGESQDGDGTPEDSAVSRNTPGNDGDNENTPAPDVPAPRRSRK